MELKKIEVKLSNLFLDPNNYRFIEKEDYVPVIDEDVQAKSVQNRTLKFLKEKGINDLIESFKDNGFLEVDNIQVRKINEDENKYIVIEGNRRIAALKVLESEYNKDKNIEVLGNLNPKIFSKVPVFLNKTDDIKKHLIIMGLKHISGNKKWDSANQAKMMYDYLKDYIGKETYFYEEEKLARSLAVNKNKIRDFLNTYHLIELYKSLGHEFINTMFSIFAEAIKKPNVCNWITWDRERYTYQDINKIERFFSWISPVPYDDDNEYEEERIINKGADIRRLNEFIKDEKSVEIMEKYRSLDEGEKNFKVKEKTNISYLLTTLEEDIKFVAKYEEILTKDQREKILNAKKLLNSSFKATTLNDEVIRINMYPLRVKEHFSIIEVINYKKLQNFKIDRLKSINILTGINNSGKTSLLEAIYILLNQNDIIKYFNLVKCRHKINELDNIYLEKIALNNFNIKGIFDSDEINVELKKYEDEEIDKKDDYLISYELTSKFGKEKNITKTHTYIYSGIKNYYKKIINICNVGYQSPYFYSQDLIEHYSKMKLEEYKGEKAEKIVLEYMKKLDSSIEEIFLVETDGIKRLMVRSSKEEDLDIHKYGEGVQRAYSLILNFMANRGGVILIDELEVGIHFSFLIELTKFIQELSEEFGVQVFITTHSDECLEAFVENNYKNEMLAFHQLVEKDGRIFTKYIGGERYKELKQAIDLEIRGEGNE